MSRFQTAAVACSGLLAVVVGAVTLIVRREAVQRAELRRDKARDMRERAEADRIEIARREREAARLGARVRATQAEDSAGGDSQGDAADSRAGSPPDGAEAPAERFDAAEQLRRADELDPELPARLVADRDRGGDVR